MVKHWLQYGRPALESIRKLIKTDALFAKTYMPRHRMATALDADLFAETLTRDMVGAGFHKIRIKRFDLNLMLVVCVLGPQANDQPKL